jgi:hypothetical protein
VRFGKVVEGVRLTASLSQSFGDEVIWERGRLARTGLIAVVTNWQ